MIRKRLRKFHGEERGQALLEFILIFPIMLLLVLGIIEFSFLTVAYQTVDLAAFNAARSATVGEDYRLASIITCIPIAPSKLGRLNPGGIPGFDEISGVFDYIGVSNLPEKALFSYALQHPNPKIKYYDDENEETESLSEASYLKATVHFLYPVKFPLINHIYNFGHFDVSTMSEYFLMATIGMSFVEIKRTCTMGIH